jgi:hypothetical protein
LARSLLEKCALQRRQVAAHMISLGLSFGVAARLGRFRDSLSPRSGSGTVGHSRSRAGWGRMVAGRGTDVRAFYRRSVIVPDENSTKSALVEARAFIAFLVVSSLTNEFLVSREGRFRGCANCVCD